MSELITVRDVRVDTAGKTLATGDLLADFGTFLRLHVADEDASPNTIRSYHTNAGQFVKWCARQEIDPARATETDLLNYRKYLNDSYTRGTVAVKLAAVKQLYEAATWRGLRAPKDNTDRSDKIKFLPLEGLRRLLDAPKGNRPSAVRDRAILGLMGRHGLRVSEVAGLTLDAVDLGGDFASREQGKQSENCALDRDQHRGDPSMACHTSRGSQRWRVGLVRLVGSAHKGQRDDGPGHTLEGGQVP